MEKISFGVLSLFFLIHFLTACIPTRNERGDTSGSTRGPLSEQDDNKEKGKQYSY